ncbi:ornithine carbamoyltransferase [Humisphaera borealis]|uniref:Ornithine carbamoyltransferase n=1 Tax=Humisphaera borealis TaxID=2807512 RepID=A0A7M2WR11_9BACT|nr:ornithine carbamoyltransferase [Humisphaera borealis]QOV87849.1 ornithine carbamoyltransferase [Humisphaera borealis]
MEHFITIAETPIDRLKHFLAVAHQLKKQHKTTGKNDPLLVGKTLAMIFEKPSLRTRVSFSVAMEHLGGNGLVLRPDEVGIGTREPVQDVARVLGGMCDGIMARTFEHDKVENLAKYAGVPVINGLTDYTHPCQAMADLMTLQEHFGHDLTGRTLTYVGDGNNVARSLSVACGKFGMHFVLASPDAYRLPQEDADRVMSIAPDMDFVMTSDPMEAVAQADAIYTDTWVSMGQEADKARKVKDFAGFAVDEKLLAAAPKHAVVLHCLPAYRGYEISEGVMEGKQSLVFPQAENRLHFQKGLIAALMGGM